MFGYIRPIRGKLSEEEYIRFRAMYCGLCHNMCRRCGIMSSFTVNYDFTFLAMLLFSGDRILCTDRRCAAHPFKKRRCIIDAPAVDKTADFSVILFWWKLRDAAWDDGFLKRVSAHFAMLFLRRGFKKASAREPDFAADVELNIRELSDLEKNKCPSVDRTADRFARILASAANAEEDAARRRILCQLLYHTGRLIYIMDAVDDLPDDLKSGNYNPLIYRYRLKSSLIDNETMNEIELTMRHSINLISSAFQLLNAGPWTDILTNVIYSGIPSVGAELLRKYVSDKETENGDNK